MVLELELLQELFELSQLEQLEFELELESHKEDPLLAVAPFMGSVPEELLEGSELSTVPFTLLACRESSPVAR